MTTTPRAVRSPSRASPHRATGRPRSPSAPSADGHSIVYTPNKKGTDAFRYRIIDSNGDNAEAIVHITVTGGDIAPHAVAVGPIDCGAGCYYDVTQAQGINLGDNGKISLV